jgi:glycine/D-amino acid oxidase-like deaminating enzyme
MTISYWLEESTEPLPRQSLDGRPDAIVVGGGVTGCSCALTLAQAGLRVRLHEAREIAGGASGRNGGFALRGGAGPYDRARASLGPERAQLLWELTERTLDRLESLAGDAFRRVGSLRLAADPAEREALALEYRALREDGLAVEWIEPDELAEPLRRLFHGAILHPQDGALQPARWVRRLARVAAESGVEIVQHNRVEIADLEAESVVVATDGFTGALLPELRALVRPTRGQVVVTEPLPELRYARPHYARAGYDYWHQLPDRRLVLGGSRDAALDEEYTDVEQTTPIVQERIEGLVERLSGFRPAITHRWAGIWGDSPDGLPLVGRVPGRDGTWIAGGYAGHGNVLGLACGDLVARAVLGDSAPELELFAPDRLL